LGVSVPLMQDGDLETVAVYNRMVQAMYTAYGSTPNGTAATANVTTSATDTTAGRLLKVGDFGLGGGVVSTEVDLAAYVTAGTYITPSSGVVDLPSGAPQDRYTLIVSGGTWITQQLTNTDTAQTWFRSGTPAEIQAGIIWNEIYHTGSTCENFTSTGIDDNATSTAITIDASENVGIGTSAPSEILNIIAATLPTIRLDLNSSVSTTGQQFGAISFGAKDNSNPTYDSTTVSSIIGGNDNPAGAWDGGPTRYDTYLAFTTSKDTVESEGMRLTSDGILSLSSAIKFPATQVPSADANTLDDYEQGGWTPVLGGDTSESGQTYAVQQGVYTKVGNTVHFSAFLSLTTAGTITTNLHIKGLPFVCGNYYVPVSLADTLGFTLTASHVLAGYVKKNNSVIVLEEVDYADGVPAKMAASTIRNGTSIMVSGTYFV